jgi:hypothetical protein
VSHGASIAESLHIEHASIDAYLIVSSIDLEFMRPNSRVTKADIKKLLRGLPPLTSFLAAFDRGGIGGLHSFVTECTTAPQSVWLCQSREEFEREMDGIYERLARSRRPYDAYDFGVVRTIGWVYMWVDW